MAVTTGTKPVVSTGDEQQEPERHTVPLHMLRVPRDGKVVAIKMVDEDSDLMFITDRGKLLRTKVNNIRSIGRNTQGVRMMVLEEDELIVSVAKLAEKEEAEVDETAAVEEAAEDQAAPDGAEE